MAGGESCFEPSGVGRPERSRQPEAVKVSLAGIILASVRPEPTFWLCAAENTAGLSLSRKVGR